MQSQKVTFPSLLDYLFDVEANEEITNAAHVKIGPAPNPCFAGELLLIALDSKQRIQHMFSFPPEAALEPVTIEYLTE